MSKKEENEEVNQDERDRLLYELVLRQSAVETLMLKKGIFTEQELAESQIECMAKIEAVINAKISESSSDEPSGFIKFGDQAPKDE